MQIVVKTLKIFNEYLHLSVQSLFFVFAGFVFLAFSIPGSVFCHLEPGFEIYIENTAYGRLEISGNLMFAS